MTAAIAVVIGLAAFIAVTWTLVVQIFFPAATLGNVSLQIFNPAEGMRWVAKAIVPATKPKRAPRARHRHRNLDENTRGMATGIGGRS